MEMARGGREGTRLVVRAVSLLFALANALRNVLTLSRFFLVCHDSLILCHRFMTLEKHIRVPHLGIGKFRLSYSFKMSLFNAFVKKVGYKRIAKKEMMYLIFEF